MWSFRFADRWAAAAPFARQPSEAKPARRVSGKLPPRKVHPTDSTPTAPAAARQAKPARRCKRKLKSKVQPTGSRKAAPAPLQEALGLDASAAKRLAEQLRSLPKAELKRRLRVLWGIDGAEDEPARKRARRSTAQKPMGPTKLAKASKAFALSMTPSSSSGEAYVMPEPEVDIFGLACADAGRCLLVWLGFADCCWLRAASRSAASVVRYVTWLRCREFVYDPIEFEPRFQKGTRSGRVRPMSQDAVSRRLVLFLRQPRHAFFIESLDLTLAPIPALESAELHEALRGAMPRLGSVLLPTDGWSAPAERKRLLANLAEAVEVAWDGAGPKTSKKKEPECSDGDGGRSSLSQVGDASSASTVGSPVRSPEHSRARSRSASAGRLGLQDLIPNWSRLSAKDRGSVFRELRQAVANGRLPPRQGPCRWEWDRDDPALAVARDACVAAGVSRA